MMPVAGEPTEPLNVQPRAEAVTCQLPEALTVSLRTAGTTGAADVADVPDAASLASVLLGVPSTGTVKAAVPAPTVLMKSRRLNPDMRKLLGSWECGGGRRHHAEISRVAAGSGRNAGEATVAQSTDTPIFRQY
jgi:hypothetical protein